VDASQGRRRIGTLSDTMRVVYIVSLFPCWSETFIVREMAQLMRRGVDVQIVSLKPASERLVQPDAAALLPRVLYPQRGLAGALGALGQVLRRPLLSLRELARIALGLRAAPAALAKSLVVWWRTLGLLPVVRALRPDHIHAHWATYPSTAAMLIAKRLGVRFSFTSHAHDIFVNDHLIADKLRRAAFAVTISEFNRRWLSRRYASAQPRRLEVIHCGLPIEEYRPMPVEREHGLIVAVGRLDQIKGFRHLVDACSELRARGTSFRCCIVGEGPLRDELESQIAGLNLSRHCVLLGALPQHEVRAVVQRAAVFVLPSVVTPRGDRDGIPVALMEAMALGTPVVSTPVSGIPELVEDGVTGLLVTPGDAQALADRIDRLLHDWTAAATLTSRARGRIESDFDVEKEADRLLQLFRTQGAAS
jgi:colanic acid/amylovoran biosynthesis glycosyltransferase